MEESCVAKSSKELGQPGVQSKSGDWPIKVLGLGGVEPIGGWTTFYVPQAVLSSTGPHGFTQLIFRAGICVCYQPLMGPLMRLGRRWVDKVGG